MCRGKGKERLKLLLLLWERTLLLREFRRGRSGAGIAGDATAFMLQQKGLNRDGIGKCVIQCSLLAEAECFKD